MSVDSVRISRLLQAVSRRDWQTAEIIGREIADAEARAGHFTSAERLRGSLVTSGVSSMASSGPSAMSMLHLLPSDRPIADVRLRAPARQAFAEIVTEWRLRSELDSHGVSRRTRVLLHGPPGCGKTLSAAALANEMGLPAYVVRFDSIVGSLLGETATRLRRLFEFVERSPAVVILDEIDALGRARGNDRDVGEIDRVVVALLQELEHTVPAGLLVAASNRARALDSALWRRFDLVLTLPRPTASELRGHLGAALRTRGLRSSPVLARALKGACNYADVDRIVTDYRRRLIVARSVS